MKDEGDRAGGEKAIALFDRSVEAFQNALQVRTKAALPQDWAETECDLGDALSDEAHFGSGEKAAALLAQAVEAYRNALTVRTKDELP